MRYWSIMETDNRAFRFIGEAGAIAQKVLNLTQKGSKGNVYIALGFEVIRTTLTVFEYAQTLKKTEVLEERLEEQKLAHHEEKEVCEEIYTNKEKSYRYQLYVAFTVQYEHVQGRLKQYEASHKKTMVSQEIRKQRFEEVVEEEEAIREEVLALIHCLNDMLNGLPTTDPQYDTIQEAYRIAMQTLSDSNERLIHKGENMQ